MKTATLLLTLITVLETFAQADRVNTYRGIAVYSELGGASLGLTLNFDKVLFRLGRWQGSVRSGFGRYNVENNRVKFLSVPIGINLFDRQLGPHHKEVGLNVSYVRGTYFIVQHVREAIVSKSIFLTPTLGYRFQKPQGSIFFKVQYSPFMLLKELETKLVHRRNPGRIVHFAGLSFGYYFGERHLRDRNN